MALAAKSSSSRFEEERELFLRAREGDGDAREFLLERYLPMAHRLARRFSWGREPLDDLLQVAGVGLVKAVDRFDPRRGLGFTAYAVPTIVGELKRHFRDNTWALRVPQRLRARAFEIERAADELRRKLGRSPSPREVGEATGASEQDVIEAVGATAAFDTVPLDSQSGDSDGVAGTLGSEDERYEIVELSSAIAPALATLDPRERLIIYLRFQRDLSQYEISRVMGMSQMHVSRLLRRSIAHVRALAVGESDGEGAGPS